MRRSRSTWALIATVVVWAAAVLLVVRMLTVPGGEEDRFDDMIREAASRHGIDPALVKAVIRQESSFCPWQVGKAGEIGLMQITGAAVKDWETFTGQRCRYRGMLFDPRLNIEIGTWYLARAVRRWREYEHGDSLALAEYNAGISRARQWAPEDPVGNVMPRVRFPSTRKYISNVIKYRVEYDDTGRAASESGQ
jgi:soluble lytic murein transglycosylase